MERNIILVGFMGTGKTTIGKLLAERLGWPFVDTDEAVEGKEGRAIPEIFGTNGEAYFRDAESAVLEEILQSEHQVISTGGGSVLRPENRQAMLRGGIVVALKASQEVLLARLEGDANRPLLSGDTAERLRKLLEERKQAYDFAHASIDTSETSLTDAVDMIVKLAGCPDK